QPDPLGDPADGGAGDRAGLSRGRRGGGATPAFRAGNRPGGAGGRPRGARPPRAGRPGGRALALAEPLLRRRPGGLPRPRRRGARRRRRPSPRRRRRLRRLKRNNAAMAGPQIDFEAEGLLDGVEGEARKARLELLQQLEGEGCTLDELKEAVAAHRLTLLPVERKLAGDGPRYTAREVAEIAELDLEMLLRFRSALGIPV